eukprot:350402-Hanusia_phi.AAC.1
MIPGPGFSRVLVIIGGKFQDVMIRRTADSSMFMISKSAGAGNSARTLIGDSGSYDSNCPIISEGPQRERQR